MRMGGQARYLEADVGDVRLASLYLPNGNPVPSDNFDYKLRWFERFNAYAKTLAGRDVFLCGDFNVVPTNEDIYNAGSWRFDAVLQPETSGACKRLLAKDWIDTARYMNPKGRKELYTFWVTTTRFAGMQASAWTLFCSAL